MKKSILIVGAGAVGQVYAYHFAKAGYQVHLLLKEKYIAEAKQGFTLYHLNQDKKRQHPISFNDFICHSNWDSVAQHTIDQVWLCVSSTALVHVDLLAMKAAIKQATVMVLQPDPADVQRVKQVFDSTQVVAGMINMISYYAPLVGEVVPKEGVAFWIPPIVPMPVEGQHQALTDVLAVLKDAQIPAMAQANFAAKNVHASSFLMVFLAVLELNNWHFKVLAHNKTQLKRMLQAQKEVFSALSAEYGTQPSYALRCLKAWMMPSILKIAQHIAPLDMEIYMEAHFTKVRAQTLMLLQAYEQRALQHQVSHEALSGLIKQLQAK
ncbi:MAG: hypothetical protein IPP76_05420 [Moraxellaceae bacterium]|nr:hypothetical protein [Moraxellaceae bacterium]